MFDAVARRYDLTNTVLSLGQDRFWRRATRAALRIGPGDTVLDLAAGTAVSTVELAASGAWCVAADFSVGMLAAGAARGVPKVAGDATQLPFADGVVRRGDHQLRAAQRRRPRRGAARDGAGDAARRPAGGVRVLHADEPAVRHGVQGVPDAGVAADGAAVSSNPDAYVYLAESIRAWPDQAELARRISDAGWSAVRWRNLTGGIVALHAATKPLR